MLLSQENVYGVVYRVTNTENGMVYIGATKDDPQSRFNYNLYLNKTKYSKALNKYKKMGKVDVFRIETICFCFDRTALNNAEKEIIRAYYLDSHGQLYNMAVPSIYELLSKKELILKIKEAERDYVKVLRENEKLKNELSKLKGDKHLELLKEQRDRLRKKHKRALQLDGRSQQWIAEKFGTSRQVVNSVINRGNHAGVYGKSKTVKDHLDKLVKKYGL